MEVKFLTSLINILESPDMILAYRNTTGCKQYCFETTYECFKYFSKKCYFSEVIKCIESHDVSNKIVGVFYFDAGCVPIEGFSYEETLQDEKR